MDQLASLVDKSLVVADEVCGATRYGMLETVRQYAAEQVATADEADQIRNRHLDWAIEFAAQRYDFVAVQFGPATAKELAAELDSFRVGLRWAIESGRAVDAHRLALSLALVWALPDRLHEGRGWFESLLDEAAEVPAPILAWTLGTSANLEAQALSPTAIARGEESLAMARQLGDRPSIALALGATAFAHAEVGSLAQARALAEEGCDVARLAGAVSALLVSLGSLATALSWTDARAILPVEHEALRVIEESGGRARWPLNTAMYASFAALRGDFDSALQIAAGVAARSDSGRDGAEILAQSAIAFASAMRGDLDSARRAATECARAAYGGPILYENWARVNVAVAFLASGDFAAAVRELERAAASPSAHHSAMARCRLAEAHLASGDVGAARRVADEVLDDLRQERTALNYGAALHVRARIALLDGASEQAEDLARRSLAARHEYSDPTTIADSLELVAALLLRAERAAESARLVGAAEMARAAVGGRRLVIYDAEYEDMLSRLAATMTPQDVEEALAAGRAMSLDEAVAYAQRGRGERKRPSSGWGSLTPTELDVVHLVADGLANKEIAEKLFMSPRTVQAHLTHVYAKLGFNSRVQLAMKAGTRR
jgi:DNA-binding CsgD family transcriptional regulator